MAKSPTSEKITLNNVRLSFAKLFKPEAYEPGKTPTFQATFLLDPSNVEHKAHIAEIHAAAKKLIEEAGFKVSDFEVAHTFGLAEKHPKKSKYDGYQGMYYVSVSNTVRPTVVDRRMNPVAEGDKNAPYSGCYVNGTFTLWLQNNKFGKKINSNLRAVQFVKDGQAFGMAPVAAEDEFQPLEGEAAETVDADSDWE